MVSLRRLIGRLLAAINRRLDIVSDDPYYAWADERLDHIALHANLAKRGYILQCDRKDCDL